MTSLRQFFAMLCVATLGFTASAAHAQSGGKPADPAPKAATADPAAKEAPKKVDIMADAATKLEGPAGNPECVWTGTRAVSRLMNDDLDTAFRHMDLYDRFGCPGAHVQATFRCIVRQGPIDLKAQDKVNDRVSACWLNPGLEPTSADATPPAPAATSGGTAKP